MRQFELTPRLGLALIVCIGAALSACGGGSNAPANEPPSLGVPAEASASSAALVGFLTTLSVTDAQDREPVGIAAFNPQQPDDTEPQALN